MQITKSNERGIYELVFTDEELLRVTVIVGSTNCGVDYLIVPPREYTEKFGISSVRTDELFTLMRTKWKERRPDEPIFLSKQDLYALTKMLEHMIEKWSGADFETIGSFPKFEAILLLQQFKKAGF